MIRYHSFKEDVQTIQRQSEASLLLDRMEGISIGRRVHMGAD